MLFVVNNNVKKRFALPDDFGDNVIACHYWAVTKRFVCNSHPPLA